MYTLHKTLQINNSGQDLTKGKLIKVINSMLFWDSTKNIKLNMHTNESNEFV